MRAPPRGRRYRGVAMIEPASERRKARRYRAHFAVSVDEVSGQRQGRVGVSQDVSAFGLLFNTRSRFEAGEEIMVTLLLKDTLAEATRVKGTVVRVEAVELRTHFPWRYMTAVRFESPVPEIEPVAKTRVVP
jgi:hypothetical protein